MPAAENKPEVSRNRAGRGVTGTGVWGVYGCGEPSEISLVVVLRDCMGLSNLREHYIQYTTMSNFTVS